MKRLWTEKRVHLIATALCMGTAAVSGSLAFVTLFDVDSLLELGLGVLVGIPVITLIVIGWAGVTATPDYRRGRGRRSSDWMSGGKYVNPHTGEFTNDATDWSGLGRGYVRGPIETFNSFDNN